MGKPKVRRLAVGILAATTAVHAEDPPPKQPITVAPLTAPAFEGHDAPKPGEATMRTGFLTSADLSTWAVRPGVFSLQERPLLVSGGEVGLTPALSFTLYGANDFMLYQFSGMNMGFRLRLLPEMSVFQVSTGAGVSQDLEGGLGYWASSSASVTWGHLRAAWAIRTFDSASGIASQPRVSSDAAITYDVRRVTFGLQQTRQIFSAAGSRAPLSAAAASVSLKPAEGWRVTATSSTIFGGVATPLRVSVFGVF